MELTGGAFSCGRIVLSPRPVAPNPLGGERDIALGAAKNPGTVSFAEPSFAVGLIDDESAAGREVLPLIIVRWNRPGIPCIGRLPLRPGIPCIGRLPPCPAAGGAFFGSAQACVFSRRSSRDR
jgi:hypothetical protein